MGAGCPDERYDEASYPDREKGFDIREEEIAVTAGRVRVTMPKTSAMILQHVDSEERYWEKQKTHRSFFY